MTSHESGTNGLVCGHEPREVAEQRSFFFNGADCTLRITFGAKAVALQAPSAYVSLGCGSLMKIFLTGATGFVGSHMLRRLLQDGHEVRALARTRPPKALVGARFRFIQGDFATGNFGEELAGCDAVINLVGIIYPRGSASFEAVHHQGTKKLVEAARQSGVRRFVQMSALGARAHNASEYHTSKFAGEEEVRTSGIDYVVLRPSLIVGPGSAFVQQMVEVMGAAPMFRPVPGTGKYRFRPVHVDDVVECFAQSLINPAATNQTIDLVGGEELTLDEIGNEIAACLGVQKKVVHVPMAVMKAAAAVFAVLPIKPPVTAVQLRMLEEGSTADPEPMQRTFNIHPIGFRQGLKTYLRQGAR